MTEEELTRLEGLAKLMQENSEPEYVREQAIDKFPSLITEIRRLKLVIAEAAICVFDENPGITDTVWMENSTTLYEHLAAELDVDLTGTFEWDLDELIRARSALRKRLKRLLHIKKDGEV